MTERTCSVPDCGKPHRARSYCHTHLARFTRNGAPTLQPTRVRGICTIGGCGRPHKGHGYCGAHLQQLHKGNEPSGRIRQRRQMCAEPGCGQQHHANGMCVAHYYEANAARYKANGAAWTRANPESVRARTARRRTRRAVQMTKADREVSLAYRHVIENDPCRYCAQTPTERHVDHYFPLAKGGTDHWWNLSMTCANCNLRKGSRCGTWFQLRRM